MVLTLFFSKKAKSVVQTSLDLSRQDVGDERFEPTVVSRAVVRSAISAGNRISKIMPDGMINWLNKQFEPVKGDLNKEEVAAFDLVRASVNLVVASVLIAFGTSLKLPLSTTYVTFMVAMGTSLADNAWGRESAVYRVAGVIAVVGGWFLTALTAFIAAFIVVSILHFGGFAAILVMVAVTAYIAYRTHSHHKRKALDAEQEENINTLSDENLVERLSDGIVKNLETVQAELKTIIKNLRKENLKGLKSSKKSISAVTGRTKYLKDNIGSVINKLRDDNENDFYFVQVLDYMREILHNASFIVKPAIDHVDNHHKPLLEEQFVELREVYDLIDKLTSLITKSITNPSMSDEDEILGVQDKLQQKIQECNKSQYKRLKKASVGTKNSILYLHLTDEMKFMGLHLVNLYKSYRDFLEYRKTSN
jgi:Na+/phosphate symporter